MSYYTESSKRAAIKYVKTHLDRIELKGKKGLKNTLNYAAGLAGQSVNAYILQAIAERMQRDGFQPPAVEAEEEEEETE